ncbi:lipid A deacylase LpxR family protein [Neptuniibacter halophilus]|uniref:lipid A deacylase LpxR family protein n=1 Tax=Neptuniibacter halophilus TaxID=651666 RepID=UPI002572E80E|nr:lipid A deacylase LpxR family protein [Neptuniibacter halophilus]
MFRTLPLIAGILISSHSQAATQDDAPWTFNLYFENDLFAETDQNYTNGVRVSWVSPNVESYLEDERLPSWVGELSDSLPLFDPPSSSDDPVLRNVVVTLGQQIYTPQDIDRATVDPDDRPYAGWLYGGVAYHSRTRNQMNSAVLNLGIVGPWALGEEAQDLIHDIRGFKKFNGWDNQLKNEPGIQLLYEHKNRINKGRLTPLLAYDLILHGGGSLGNVATYLNAGAELRLGWNLPQDFGTSALRSGGDNSAPGIGDGRYQRGSRNSNLGLHGFISADGRWVLRDIFLDGNTFRDSHSIDKESLVGETAIGIAALYHGWKISFARVHRSREYAGQEEGHTFGSLSLSYSY